MGSPRVMCNFLWLTYYVNRVLEQVFFTIHVLLILLVVSVGKDNGRKILSHFSLVGEGNWAWYSQISDLVLKFLNVRRSTVQLSKNKNLISLNPELGVLYPNRSVVFLVVLKIGLKTGPEISDYVLIKLSVETDPVEVFFSHQSRFRFLSPLLV